MNLPHKEPSLSGDFMEGEGTFFRTHSITIQESISQEAFKNFANLSTDEERLKFVYMLDAIHKIELPTSPFKKNSHNALNHKNQGNAYFGKEKYKQAAKFYSFALIDCPDSEDVLLSTLFANRSAALYHLEEYHKALQDIELALSLPYPENLHHKVLERKARCHLALKEHELAVESFKKTMPALEKSGMNSQIRQKRESDIAIMVKLLTKTISDQKVLKQQKKQIAPKNELPPVPNVAGVKNKKYNSASNLVDFIDKPSEGRFAVANENIEPGEVLVVEKAHCATLLMEYSKSHCQECFVRVAYPIPCPYCPSVVFCSIKCRKNALNTYHKYECNFLGSLWTSGSSVVCNMAIRLITQRGLQYFLNLKNKLNKKLDNEEKYNTADYRTVYNLCRHEHERSYVDFFQRTVMAIVLLKFLQQTGFFKTEITKNLTEDEIFIGGLLLHNLQVLQFNAHEIAELQYNSDYPGEIERAKSQFIGGGLFPTLALFNHSCEPGIVRYFSGSKVIVRSVKPIPLGSIIAENYGPIYTEVKRETRRIELKARYWFDCNCQPCVENWPLFDEMKTDILPFKCIKGNDCSGVFKVNTNTDEFMFPCPKCSEMICIFGSLKGLNDTEAMFNRGDRYVKDQKYNDALAVFLKIMKILNGILGTPYKDFCLCQQKIRSCMLTFGNVYQPA